MIFPSWIFSCPYPKSIQSLIHPEQSVCHYMPSPPKQYEQAGSSQSCFIKDRQGKGLHLRAAPKTAEEGFSLPQPLWSVLAPSRTGPCSSRAPLFPSCLLCRHPKGKCGLWTPPPNLLTSSPGGTLGAPGYPERRQNHSISPRPRFPLPVRHVAVSVR